MKKPSTLIIFGMCAAGLLCGFATRHLSVGRVASAPAPGVSSGEPASGEDSALPGSAASRVPGRPAPAEIPHRRSSDTLETLAVLGGGELYTRLAVWLTDASEGDIAAFWKTYGPRAGRSNDITDLVFLNWTRLDPRAAVAASSNDEHAWWAWACHDPKAALAAATAEAPDHVNNVAWGIGEFHPDWLREHYKELSEDARSHALDGMAKWDDGQDPLAALKFLKEIGGPITKGAFRALVRQDPWAALAWVKENQGMGESGYDFGDDPMQLIVATLASERPDDLERLAAQTPSGAAKLQMESALFDNLRKTDPQAALAAAKETSAPRIAAERFAALGLGIVKTDPEQAFGLAKDLFAKCPDAMAMVALIEYPNGGSSGSGVEIPGVQDFLQGLMAKDPARTLEMTSSIFAKSSFSELANTWAQRDFVAYANWVNRQTDRAVHDSGANIVINNLQQQGNYAESADWILSRKEGAGGYGISDMLANWKRIDAQAAASWLEAADLPAARKAELRTYFDSVNSH